MSNRAFIRSLMAIVLSMISFMGATAQHAPSPAPALSSDGSAVDQGIAYILMMVALLLTYFLH